MSVLALLFATLALGQAEPAPDTSGWKRIEQSEGDVLWIDPVLQGRDGNKRRFRARMDNPGGDAFAIFEAEADCSAISIEMIGGKVYQHGIFQSEKKASPGDTLVMTDQDTPGTGKSVAYICGL